MQEKNEKFLFLMAKFQETVGDLYYFYMNNRLLQYMLTICKNIYKFNSDTGSNF